jgi:hypothetical protein
LLIPWFKSSLWEDSESVTYKLSFAHQMDAHEILNVSVIE